MGMAMDMARARVSRLAAERSSMVHSFPQTRFASALAGFALLGMLFLGLSPAQGAEWQVSKSVSLTETYSDNIDLDDSNKKSAFITSVTPSISLQGKGGRARVNLSGSLGFNTRSSGGSSISPNIRGDANAELVRQKLFVDADASISRVFLDPYGPIGVSTGPIGVPSGPIGVSSGPIGVFSDPIGVDTLNSTRNTTTFMQFSVSPYYRDRLKDVGDFEARYRYSSTLFSGNGDNSGDHSLSLSLNSGKNFSRLIWGIGADYRRTSYDGERSSRSETSTDGTLGYRFNRKLSVDGSVGREWNDIPSTRSKTGGFRWSLNSTWTPNPRTSVRIGYGHRFFGSTPTLDVSYRRRRSTLTASYSKVLTDANTELRTLAIDPVTGQIFPVALLNRDIFVDERFTGSYSISGKRTTVTLSGTRSRQVYQISPDRSELTKLGLSVSRALSGRVSTNASVNWYQQDQSAANNAETWQGILGMSVKVGEKTRLAIKYSYNKRIDDQPGDSYEENRISASLSMSL